MTLEHKPNRDARFPRTSELIKNLPNYWGPGEIPPKARASLDELSSALHEAIESILSIEEEINGRKRNE